MIDPKIHIGEIHGIFLIKDVLPEKDKYGHWIYDCICLECGFHRYSHYGAIAGEKSVIYTCKHKRANGEYLTYGYKWGNKRIGKIFKSMTQRCYNVNDKDYSVYGGKGIIICDEWLYNPPLFEQWSLANGYQNDLTIDRIDSNKNYCPDNCQWISLEENSRKAGNVNWITVNEETLTGRQWAEECNVSINTINTMLRNYDEEDVVEFIRRRLMDKTKKCRCGESWFGAYNINTTK